MKPRTKKTPVAVGAPLFIKDPLTPAALTEDANNYSPTGLAGATWLRLDSGAVDVSISGLATGAAGRFIMITNIGTTNTIELANESALSSAANRITCPNGQPLAIRYGGSCTLIYDGESSRWRPTSATRF